MIRRRAALLFSMLVVVACGPRSSAPASDRNLISTEELRASAHADAYAVVQSLRPLWLRTRGPASLTLRQSVKVYLDGSLMGGPDQLRQIPTHSITSMRFIDGVEATQRWGLDHDLGVIFVSTRGVGDR